MWLVVHIPKTAGTSLRCGLKEYHGKANIIRDYGPDAKESSKIVKKHLYKGRQSLGPESLVAQLLTDDKQVLIGHFSLQKYSDYFEAQQTIAFVRDPLVRMCSEFLHRVNNKSFTGSFQEFLSTPAYQNIQSRFLEGVSEDTFIGITEKYTESLQYLNEAANWDIPNLIMNVNVRGGGQQMAESLSVRESDLFYTTNADDMDIYQLASQRFVAMTSVS